MAKDLGRVALVNRGSWDSTKSDYEKLDVVIHEGSTYYCIAESVPAGTLLTDTDYWIESSVGAYGAAKLAEYEGTYSEFNAEVKKMTEAYEKATQAAASAVSAEASAVRASASAETAATKLTTIEKEIAGLPTGSEVADAKFAVITEDITELQGTVGESNKNYVEDVRLVKDGTLVESKGLCVGKAINVSLSSVGNLEYCAGIVDGIVYVVFYTGQNGTGKAIDYFAANALPRTSISVPITTKSIRMTFYGANKSEAYLKLNDETIYIPVDEVVSDGAVSDIESLNTDVNTIKEVVNDTTEIVIDGYYLKTEGGAVTQGSAWCYTAKHIPANYGDVVEVYFGCTGVGGVCALVEYDEEYKRVNDWSTSGYTNVRTITLTKEATTYIKCCLSSDNLDNCYIKINGEVVWSSTKGLLSRVSVLEENTSNITTEDVTEGTSTQKDINAVNTMLLGTPSDKAIDYKEGCFVNASKILTTSPTSKLMKPLFLAKGESITITTSSDYNNFLMQVASADIDLIIDSTVSGKTLLAKKTTALETLSYTATEDMWVIASMQISNGVATAVDLADCDGFLQQEINDLKAGIPTTDVVSMYKDLEFKRDNMAYLADFSCLFFSDVHGMSTNLTRIITLGNAWKSKLNCIVNGGDIVQNRANESIDWFNTLVATSELDMITAIGNHDVKMNDGSDNTAVNTYERYLATPLSLMSDVVQPDGAAENGLCYYYKDYGSTVRLIVLDAYTPNAYWNEAENTWLQSVLDDAKTNSKSVIIVNHVSAGSSTKIPCEWNTLYDIESWKAQQAAIVTVQSFIDNGGSFVCWLCGHTHYDNFVTPEGYPDQPMFVTASASSQLGKADVSKSGEIDISYDLFNMVSVDTTHKLLKVMRIGCNSDYKLNTKDILVYDYANKEVLHYAPQKIGELTELQTSDKENLVAAINELVARVAALEK